MTGQRQARLKPYLTLFRWLLIGISYAYIYWYVQSYEHLSAFWHHLSGNLPASSSLFGLTLMLVPVNWGLEALKWKKLIAQTHPLSFNNSFRAVFSGLSVGIFTPKRIGEIGGRIAYLPKAHRLKGGYFTLLGSLAQHITTLTVGAIATGIIFFGNAFAQLVMPDALKTIMVIGFLLIYACCLFFYFKSSTAINVIRKISWLKRRIPVEQAFHTPWPLLVDILLISHMRYLVFATQFALMLYYFQVDISWAHAFCGIAATYFLLSLLPSTSLIELGIRGSVALFVIGGLSTPTPGILFASMLLWIINLALPSLLGSVLFLKKR
ncbi:MAG: hypothetical protein R6U66_01160 [Bacteroidales bacterium]